MGNVFPSSSWVSCTKVMEHVGGKRFSKKSEEGAFLISKQKQLNKSRTTDLYTPPNEILILRSQIQGLPDADTEPLMPDTDRHGELHHRAVRQPSLGLLDPGKLIWKLRLFPFFFHYRFYNIYNKLNLSFKIYDVFNSPVISVEIYDLEMEDTLSGGQRNRIPLRLN